jgi:hypothetical protein
MNQFDFGRPVKSLLSEYVDGGPGCIRDDCDLRESFNNVQLDSNVSMIEEKVRRCVSCGKSWTEKYQNGAKIS